MHRLLPLVTKPRLHNIVQLTGYIGQRPYASSRTAKDVLCNNKEEEKPQHAGQEDFVGHCMHMKELEDQRMNQATTVTQLNPFSFLVRNSQILFFQHTCYSAPGAGYTFLPFMLMITRYEYWKYNQNSKQHLGSSVFKYY